jgi:hypothetical protein
MTKEEAKISLEKVFGPRIAESILSQFEAEEQTLWGLYNAVTYKASHEERSETNREMLMVSANVLAKTVLKEEGSSPSS